MHVWSELQSPEKVALRQKKVFLGNISIWTNLRFSIFFLECDANCRHAWKNQPKSSRKELCVRNTERLVALYASHKMFSDYRINSTAITVITPALRRQGCPAHFKNTSARTLLGHSRLQFRVAIHKTPAGRIKTQLNQIQAASNIIIKRRVAASKINDWYCLSLINSSHGKKIEPIRASIAK